MYSLLFRNSHATLWLCFLLLQCTHNVSSRLVLLQPNARTIWRLNEEYKVLASSDGKNTVNSQQVDLVYSGDKCEGMCLRNSMVESYGGISIDDEHSWIAPRELPEDGKHSKHSSEPIDYSETFTIAGPKKREASSMASQEQIETSSLPVAGYNENAASSYVFPAAVVSAFSCVFAFLLL